MLNTQNQNYQLMNKMSMYKPDLNELDQLQKTINDLKILKENCVEEDKEHWSNLIDYYTSLQQGEIEF